jgi:hypothetical protein
VLAGVTLVGYTTNRAVVGVGGIEDACLLNWRSAPVEVGLFAEGTTAGGAVFHGTLRSHDASSILLATETGLGLVLISRRAIAYIRPHSRPVSESSRTRRAGDRYRQGTGHR